MQLVKKTMSLYNISVHIAVYGLNAQTGFLSGETVTEAHQICQNLWRACSP